MFTNLVHSLALALMVFIRHVFCALRSCAPCSFAGARTTPRAQLLFVFSRGFLADKRKDNIGYPIGKSVFSLKPIWQKLQIGTSC